MVRAAVRDFIEKELVPHHRELEHGDLPPYDIIRKLFSTFGMDAMARDRFARQIAREKAGDAVDTDDGGSRDPKEAANAFRRVLKRYPNRRLSNEGLRRAESAVK